MTGERYSLERGVTSLHLIDLAFKQRGLRGLLGFAWSAITRERKGGRWREKEGERGRKKALFNK